MKGQRRRRSGARGSPPLHPRNRSQTSRRRVAFAI